MTVSGTPKWTPIYRVASKGLTQEMEKAHSARLAHYSLKSFAATRYWNPIR